MGRAVSLAALGLLGVVFACSSSADESEPVTMTELARQEIGPAGGTVRGGAVTIDIPEGALAETRAIVINRLNPEAGNLPQATTLAGELYALQPDDVEFAKPVTVTVDIDPSRKRSDGLGAIVLFRSASGANQWTPRGANDTSATALVGKTTHFSWWAPTTAAETRCFRGMCNAIPPPIVPGEPLPGADAPLVLDCRVPAEGPSVRCVGRGANRTAPYECFCDGSDVILGSWQKLPPDTAITAMAAQCGAVCPASATCGIGVACDLGVSAPAWRCSTRNKEPAMTCAYDGAAVASCSCSNGKSFTLPGVTRPVTDPMVFSGWVETCGGSCDTPDLNDDWVCAGLIAPDTPPNGSCSAETAGTCRDNHFYGYECDAGAFEATRSCRCTVDGVQTKTVQASCVNAHEVCGIPKIQGR
ncbi:MAG: hypothetical protein KF764_26695 [Labilithrix sp.]|nr:hypothetical protein [Labilithrix sp.]